jgi:hypothetical protein
MPRLSDYDKAMKERAAARDEVRANREFFGLDNLPPDLSYKDKMGIATSNLALQHAQHMVANGRMTKEEHQKLGSGLWDAAIDAMPPEEYRRATGRAQNAAGAWVDVGPDMLTPARNQVHRDDNLDLHENKREQAALGRRVLRDFGATMNLRGVPGFDDASLGKWLSDNDALPDGLLSERGEPIGDHTRIGVEVALELASQEMGHEPYAAGTATREEIADYHAREMASDPALKARAEMVVPESEAQAWRDRQERDILESSPHGREVLKKRTELTNRIEDLQTQLQSISGPSEGDNT